MRQADAREVGGYQDINRDTRRSCKPYFKTPEPKRKGPPNEPLFYFLFTAAAAPLLALSFATSCCTEIAISSRSQWCSMFFWSSLIHPIQRRTRYILAEDILAESTKRREREGTMLMMERLNAELPSLSTAELFSPFGNSHTLLNRKTNL